MDFADDGSLVRIPPPDIRGTWKVVGSQCFREVDDVGGLEGCEVTFHDAELTWRKTEAAKSHPLTQCDSYETLVQHGICLLKFAYSLGNQVIPFRLEIPSADALILRYESACELRLVRVGLESRVAEKPYSLIDALNEGYFSDVSLRSVDGMTFRAHELVLTARFHDATWWKASDFTPMLPAFALRALLTYAYSECLPSDISEENIKRTLKLVRKWAVSEASTQGLARFVDLCELFLKNTALKQNVRSLLDDVQSCLERVTDLFNGKFVLSQLRSVSGVGRHLSSDGTEQAGTEQAAEHKSNLFFGIEVELVNDQLAADWLVSNPRLTVKILKLSLKECVVMMCKIVIICDLFARRKTSLTRQERHEIMKYTKSRVQAAIEQTETLLAVLKRHCDELTPEQRAELAQHLVGHTEAILSLIPDFLVESRAAFEQALKVVTGTEQSGVATGASAAGSSLSAQAEESGKSGSGTSGNSLTRLIKNLIHVKEVLKMKSWYERATRLVERCAEKRDLFADMTHEQKVQGLDKALEAVVDEAAWSVLRIQGLVEEFDSTVRWRDWKYWFKLVSARVSWAVGKLQAHRDILRPIMTRVISTMNSDEFRSSLVSMGLYVDSSVAASACASASTSVAGNSSSIAVSASSSSSSQYASPSAESLCRPPSARDSELATQCFCLLNRASNTDLVFEFAAASDKATPEATGDASSADETACVCGLSRCSVVTEIQAHRVVLAARSDWFKSALLSGMREAIDQRISVHDCTPHAFKLFLNYLYTSQPIPAPRSELTLDDLADLLHLADRYSEKELKRHCEDVLIQHVLRMEHASSHQDTPTKTVTSNPSSSRPRGSLFVASGSGSGSTSRTGEENKSAAVGDDVIVALLSVAEQCNAERLRQVVVLYMLQHPDVIRRHAAEFNQLPNALQEEIRSLISSQVVPTERSPRGAVKPDVSPVGLELERASIESDADEDPSALVDFYYLGLVRDAGLGAGPLRSTRHPFSSHKRSHRHGQMSSGFHNDGEQSSDDQGEDSSSSSNDDDADDVDTLIRARLGLSDSAVQRPTGRVEQPQPAVADDDDVDAQLSRAVDNQRLEECITRLDEILSGLDEPPSRQQLINYIIAADYDINRAINFILN